MLKQITIVALIVLISCKGSQKPPVQDKNPQDVIVEILGNKFEKFDRGDLSLCYTTDTANRTSWKTVLVINNKSSEVIYGPERLNAEITWHADRKLLIKEKPERIEGQYSTETYTYIFNIDTQKKESNDL